MRDCVVANSSKALSPHYAPKPRPERATPISRGLRPRQCRTQQNSPQRGKIILLISVATVGANRIRPVLYSH